MDQGLIRTRSEAARAPDAARFALSFAQHGSRALIGDLSTRVETLELEGQLLPLTVNDGDEPTNSYLVRPSTAYVDYAIAETRNFAQRPAFRRAMSGAIAACRPLLRETGLDRQVQVNNWLLSTNPAPTLDRAGSLRLAEMLAQRFPTHAAVIRSLNDLCDASTIASLDAAGWLLLPARQVYILDPSAPAGRDGRRDIGLLDAGDYSVVNADTFEEHDFRRCAELYAMLYLDKYTPLNPHYSALYLREMHDGGIIEVFGLRGSDGTIDAVCGLFTGQSTLTNPIVGYHTSRPATLGLYRRVMALSMRIARQRGLIFNMSAGAAGFKRNRGARSAIEYTAVHVRHLPRRRRVASAIVGGILRSCGVPLLRRHQL